MQSAGSGDNASMCTPRIIQVTLGGSINLDDCPSDVGPEVLILSDEPSKSIANVNNDGWNSYLNGDNPVGEKDTKAARILFARFVLCDMISDNIDLSLYINDDELIKYTDDNGNTVIKQAKNCSDCYKYKPNISSNIRDGINGAGTISGLFGIYNDNTYKLHNFSRKFGTWILLALLLSVFGVMFFKSKSKSIPSNKQ